MVPGDAAKTHQHGEELLFHSSDALCKSGESTWIARGLFPQGGRWNPVGAGVFRQHQVFPGLLSTVSHSAGHRHLAGNQPDVVPVLVSRPSVRP